MSNHSQSTQGVSVNRKPLGQAVHEQSLNSASRVLGLSAVLAGSMLGVPNYANAQMVLEEVVVTARKRVESLQDAPVSIQVLNNTTLQELGISDFDDYALMLPSVSYQTNGPGLSQVYMRGAADGGDGNASGSSPSVAIYLDEQPVTAIGRNLDVHIYDVERVEALAGPQSTLFGASSQAGTLRIITNKPKTEEFEAGFDVGLASTENGDPSYTAEGFVNQPLGDKAAIRLVAWSTEDGGYIDNVPGTRTYGLFTNGGEFSTVQENNAALVKDDFNKLENQGVRAAVKLDINDKWSTTLGYLYQEQDTKGVWSHDPDNPNGEVGELEIQRFYPDSMNDKFDQLSVTVEGDLGFASLIYAGSFMERDVEYQSDYSDYSDYYSTNWIQYYGCEYYGTADVDCTSMGIYYQDDNKYKRDTHEIRLQSQGDGKLQYVGGLYYEESSHKYRQEWVMDGMAQGADFSLFGQPNLWYLTDQKREDEQTAVFGEISYDISDQLTATVGGRYFDNDSSLKGVSGYGLIAPGFPIINVDSSTGDTDSIYKANLTYNINDDMMIYATWSEGYRPGGINRDATDVVPRVYKSDFITNYEFGWKTTWMGQRLRWNGAVYQMDWDDMQFTRFDSSFNSPVGLTINASEAQIRGMEQDLTFLLAENWTLSASAAYNDATLAEDLVVGSNSSPDGTELPYVPEWKANLWTRYGFDIGGLHSYVQVVYAFVDESYNDIFKYKGGDTTVDQRKTQSSYDIVNLSAGIEQGDWGVDLYVNNATDEHAELTRPTTSYDTSITTNRPRTIGLRYRMRF